MATDMSGLIVPPKPKRVCRYHETEAPKGKIFLQDKWDEIAEDMEDEGWVDTPAGFKKDKPDPNKAAPADQNSHAALIKSFSDTVLVGELTERGKLPTEDQFKAMAASIAPDEDLLAEVEDRGLLPALSREKTLELCEMHGIAVQVAGGASELDGVPLINRFYQSPTSLTKEELIILGNQRGVSLRMNMNEQTMIDRITETMPKDKPEGQ